MLNYYLVQFQEKDNKDIHGYKLQLDDEELEILLYDIDKISHKDLIQKKKEFFNFICNKYQDVDRRSLLLIFAYIDDDMFEYYKEQYLIEEKQVGSWIYKDCPKRTKSIIKN